MLIDQATIFAKAGNGGDGVTAFRRETFVPKGGPNGGDGGDGGDVILEATPGVDTLLDMVGRHHWYAENGKPGMGSQCTGAAGADHVIPVPPGTLVYDDETGHLLSDLDTPGKRLIVARGGRGGLGNEHFKSSTNQTPRQCTPGEAGEQRRVRLELKLIADVGLVGLPNAGKSTLLSRISRATPKIADYPFTTLEPQLGIAELTGFRRMVIADIPGLIAGAAHGAGLGHDFLRHIERTRILVHLLELEPSDGSDPVENYHTICAELKEHSATLAAKPQILVINKADLLGDADDVRTAVELLAQAIGESPMVISAVTGAGTRELLEACWEKLDKQAINPQAEG